MHVTELRTAINEVRAALGVAGYDFTDPILTAQSTTIRTYHIAQLRYALDLAYVLAWRTPPTYTDPAPSFFGAGLRVKAVHLYELRTALLNIQ